MTIRDPDLIDNQGQVIREDNPVPEGWRSGYRQRNRQSYEQKFKKRSLEELCQDNLAAFDKLAESFDRIAQLQKEKNLLHDDILAAKKALNWEKRIRSALLVIVSGEAVVIGWLVTVVSHVLK